MTHSRRMTVIASPATKRIGKLRNDSGFPPASPSPYAGPMAKKPGPSKKKAVLVGVGLDSDGHKRVTTGPNFAMVGGTEGTHEVMVEKAIKINEHLKRRGKDLAEVSGEEFDDIAQKVGLRRADSESSSS